MIKITINDQEFWDERTQQFYTIKRQTLRLEHSLISISEWESKWKKPFLSSEQRTRDETVDYIRCMTINPNVDPLVYLGVTNQHIKLVNQYIDDPMTASRVDEKRTGAKAGGTVTSELIYYWMTELNIPFECQKWHLNRLLMLIRICNAKKQPDKKASKKDDALYRRKLNAARKGKLHSKG